ncbi:hypothetical protein [Streptomyces iconiensis]|uniref:Uncharacterized protein n=1 Tax=Streptomyces iconiensis TaxID=1384038 RepID=A0ABT6ZYJ1_9ACTN|nr:hypothetical protein [Streptomyces iconiensis]MDJ1134129.1 hypothetical protein [Streptomyces iconiensis]
MNRNRAATELALSAVVAELRKGLRAHDIRARDVVSRTAHQGRSGVDVRGMSLGDAAVLAVVLNESAPGAKPASDG